MNILFDVGHPAHVHLLRNAYFELQKRGYQVIVTVKDIPIAKQLLTNYGIPFISLGEKKDSLLGKALEQLRYDWTLLRIAYKHKIDIGVGSSITVAHASRFSKMKSIILDDDDDAVEPLFVKYAFPFCDTILSPDALHRANKKTIYYPGYHELAYLHPNRFQPDSKVLDEIGVKEGEKFFVLRFNAFKAHHDVGVSGLSMENKRKLVQLLAKHGRVFITTERDIDAEFKPYQISVPPEKIHSMLAFATMFIGDSQTMTSEAAVLGTPSIRSNSFVGRIAYLENEEHTYGLTYGFLPADTCKMLEKIEQLLSAEDLPTQWEEKRQRLLADKIDVTAFFVWFIENYPLSRQKAQSGEIDWNMFR